VPDNIQLSSLSWALAHVRKFGDSDIFPVPFEYEAIAHDWNSIGPDLHALDFDNHKVFADRRLMVIKPGGGFRAAIQLDPRDQLLYTAAVFEAAPLVEAARIPRDLKVACSHRLDLTPEGAFFSPDTGWKDFHTRSKELARTNQFSHVLLADISDFYNQLGQHRIQNALEMVAVSAERSRNVEKFLNQLTAKQSQGLPVGPTASDVLAEACLIDVDNFLLRQNLPHVRYADDFHIFCTSRRQAIEIRHALSEYLFAVHRLSLGSSKSSVQHVSQFLKELSDPEEAEQQAKVDKLSELIRAFEEEHGGYSFEDPESPDKSEMLGQAEREALVDLFRQCVERRPLQLGLARYLLRKASQSRTVVLNQSVFENLDSLAPALRDVTRYLAVTIPKAQAAERGRQLVRFCAESDVGNLPFVRMWIVELLVRRPDLCGANIALPHSEESARHFGIRPTALLAKVHNQIDWVRALKETWRNHEPCRRGLIWSTSVLPGGERRPFLSMVVEQGDALDAAVAKLLLSQC
jgi:hypothetical protein